MKIDVLSISGRLCLIFSGVLAFIIGCGAAAAQTSPCATAGDLLEQQGSGTPGRHIGLGYSSADACAYVDGWPSKPVDPDSIRPAEPAPDHPVDFFGPPSADPGQQPGNGSDPRSTGSE
jgi:hypothetical protein